MNIREFNSGDCFDVYKWLGAHYNGFGTMFRVYAPNADGVSVIGDFNGWEDWYLNRTGDGKFSPDAPCTRAQAVTFLFRAAKAEASGAPDFRDVAADAYYAAAVKWATDNGITQGVGDGLFAPDQLCTRSQIVTFLWRVYHK